MIIHYSLKIFEFDFELPSYIGSHAKNSVQIITLPQKHN